MESGVLERVNELIASSGCLATELGPPAVGVKGDAREYGPSVFVIFPTCMSADAIAHISTLITNRIAEVNRVLMYIPKP